MRFTSYDSPSSDPTIELPCISGLDMLHVQSIKPSDLHLHSLGLSITQYAHQTENSKFRTTLHVLANLNKLCTTLNGLDRGEFFSFIPNLSDLLEYIVIPIWILQRLKMLKPPVFLLPEIILDYFLQIYLNIYTVSQLIGQVTE